MAASTMSVRETGTCWEARSREGTFGWLRGVDLNHRPLGYEPNELPDCSTPRTYHNNLVSERQTGRGALIQPTDILPPLSWSVMNVPRGKERACGLG